MNNLPATVTQNGFYALQVVCQRVKETRNTYFSCLFAAEMSYGLVLPQLCGIIFLSMWFTGSFEWIRSQIYDFIIIRMTKHWYRAVLGECGHNEHMLDVGIGTGAALVANRELVVRKQMRVTGVDYVGAYVARCQSLLALHKLDREGCSVTCQSIYDFKGENGPYDCIYFSGSLMIMPDPVAALVHVQSLLRPRGCIYITQTIEGGKTRKRWLELLKPALKFLTTIDFGTITYEREFMETLERANLKILKDEYLTKAGSMNKQARMFVVTPK